MQKFSLAHFLFFNNSSRSNCPMPRKMLCKIQCTAVFAFRNGKFSRLKGEPLYSPLRFVPGSTQPDQSGRQLHETKIVLMPPIDCQIALTFISSGISTHTWKKLHV